LGLNTVRGKLVDNAMYFMAFMEGLSDRDSSGQEETTNRLETREVPVFTSNGLDKHNMACQDVDHVAQHELGRGVSRMLRETMLQPICTTMCCADDVRKGYKECFADGDGPYTVPSYGGRHTLPACLISNGFTHEQCALAAAQAGYEV
jgi:hypothetical protein